MKYIHNHSTSLVIGLLFVSLGAIASAQSAHAASLFSPSSVPGIPATTDTQQVELGARFTSDISGFVTGIRFYKGATNTGPHIGKLWTSVGTLLGSVAFTGESASGWQQQDFVSPIQVATNTQYIASYHTASGNYAFDINYFNNPVDNAPLHAPALTNGVYQYGAGGFPSSTYNASNYWVDVVFATSTEPLPPDTIPPSVSITAPADNATVSGTIAVNANAADDTGVSGVQFFLDGATLGAEDTISPYGISWNTASVINGVHILAARARDAAGNTATSTAVTVTVSNGVIPTQGPGGPILIIASGSNPFTTYYKEILLAEGFNMYRMMDISNVTDATLDDYDVVILGEMPLTGTQATMFSDWVTNDGGNLIAMRPDADLASLLGLMSQGATLSDAYFRVNTASAPGVGIVSSALQFHGIADRYTLNGATQVATLYSNISTSLNIPAVTTRTVGTSGGDAASFAFDLAKSVVYTRQGNPAWSGQDRRADFAETGSTLIRPMDLFYGAASFDPQSDWVNFTNIEIPQADETQRLLANLIQNMLASQKPVPHFWYLPRGEKAAVVMTGDDHANGGTAGRFNQYLAQSTSGCNVADWDCIRSTSYVYPNSPLTNSQAAGYIAQGFEVALHPNAGCQDPLNLTGAFANDFSAFTASYPGVPAPRTVRTHCGPWPDYDSHSQIAANNHGVRFDTNYYYWPPSWMQDRPGLFTGSGMPQHFTDRNGAIIDAYQAPTQLTDESGQSYPLHVDTLLDNALGQQGYYGMFVLNAHTDNASSAVSDAVVASAQSRGVPMISARQALDWLDGKYASSFGNMAWSAASSTLSFTIVQDSRARGLTTLIPASFGGQSLVGITRNGVSIPTTSAVVKGISYAQFASDAGAYQAIYGSSPSDNTPPAVSITVPAPDATVFGPLVGVSASASDNIAVSGVQFLLDGANLGTEDMASPYSTLWDTTTATNGSHTLTARARDAAGNASTSAPVNITVSNTTASPSGLIAAYGFNTGSGATLSDSSGNNHAGSISGATWTPSGRYGSALSFDGVNDWVTVNDSNLLDLTTAMTLEAWVYPTATLNGWRATLVKEGPSPTLPYYLYANSPGNQPAVAVTISGTEYALKGGVRPANNVWTHLAGTYDGATQRLYINGVQVASQPRTGSMPTTASPLRMGGNSLWGEYFTGRIDEVRVYNRALTASEVQTDMNVPI